MGNDAKRRLLMIDSGGSGAGQGRSGERPEINRFSSFKVLPLPLMVWAWIQSLGAL
jgi:hypothetical protein